MHVQLWDTTPPPSLTRWPPQSPFHGDPGWELRDPTSALWEEGQLRWQPLLPPTVLTATSPSLSAPASQHKILSWNGLFPISPSCCDLSSMSWAPFPCSAQGNSPMNVRWRPTLPSLLLMIPPCLWVLFLYCSNSALFFHSFPSSLFLKHLFITLCQVLVVACGIFTLCCSTQNP